MWWRYAIYHVHESIYWLMMYRRLPRWSLCWRRRRRRPSCRWESYGVGLGAWNSWGICVCSVGIRSDSVLITNDTVSSLLRPYTTPILQVASTYHLWKVSSTMHSMRQLDPFILQPQLKRFGPIGPCPSGEVEEIKYEQPYHVKREWRSFPLNHTCLKHLMTIYFIEFLFVLYTHFAILPSCNLCTLTRAMRHAQ